MNAYIGTIMLWSSPDIPSGWLACDGSRVTILDYNALYSVISNLYGPSSQTHFYLPDLRSRIPIGAGQGPGLLPYSVGDTGGSELVTLTSSQVAPHIHPAQGIPNLSGSVSLSASGSLPARQAPGTSRTPGPGLCPAQAPDYGSSGFPDDNIYGPTDGSSMSVDLTISPNPARVSISGSVGVTVQSNLGGGQGHPNIQPYLAIQYVIAFLGDYPS